MAVGYSRVLVCESVTDPRHGWMSVCRERFGEVPVQLLHEWNTVTHVRECGVVDR